MVTNTCRGSSSGRCVAWLSGVRRAQVGDRVFFLAWLRTQIIGEAGTEPLLMPSAAVNSSLTTGDAARHDTRVLHPTPHVHRVLHLNVNPHYASLLLPPWPSPLTLVTPTTSQVPPLWLAQRKQLCAQSIGHCLILRVGEGKYVDGPFGPVRLTCERGPLSIFLSSFFVCHSHLSFSTARSPLWCSGGTYTRSTEVARWRGV